MAAPATAPGAKLGVWAFFGVVEIVEPDDVLFDDGPDVEDIVVTWSDVVGGVTPGKDPVPAVTKDPEASTDGASGPPAVALSGASVGVTPAKDATDEYVELSVDGYVEGVVEGYVEGVVEGYVEGVLDG
jgi:hypothetical protein